MSVALQKGMTLAEFLDWEERQELRYEFDGLRTLLFMRLEGKPCRPWGPTTKIEVQGHIRYPDAYVNCTPGQSEGHNCSRTSRRL